MCVCVQPVLLILFVIPTWVDGALLGVVYWASLSAVAYFRLSRRGPVLAVQYASCVKARANYEAYVDYLNATKLPHKV